MTIAVSTEPTADAATAPARTPARHRRTANTVIAALAVALVVVVIVSLGSGQFALSPATVVGILLERVGIHTPWAPEAAQATGVVMDVRLPRLIHAVLVGAALATAGVLMQAVFGNPLADAAVLGVSAGAAFGAATSMAFSLSLLGVWTTPTAAFFGGLAAVTVVAVVSRSGGRTEVVTMLLAGVAVNAIAGAGLALMTVISDNATREQIVFWQLGSLNGSLWRQLGVTAPIVVVGVIVALLLAPRLDLFSLGERTARHLGLRTGRLRLGIVLTVAVLVSAAVSFAGIIGFVGLIVPHLLRLVMGPAHLPLLIASVLGGALLVSLADLVARTAIPLADLPIGMLTALIGAPFFLWILVRTRRASGGWA